MIIGVSKLPLLSLINHGIFSLCSIQQTLPYIPWLPNILPGTTYATNSLIRLMLWYVFLRYQDGSLDGSVRVVWDPVEMAKIFDFTHSNSHQVLPEFKCTQSEYEGGTNVIQPLMNVAWDAMKTDIQNTQAEMDITAMKNNLQAQHNTIMQGVVKVNPATSKAQFQHPNVGPDPEEGAPEGPLSPGPPRRTTTSAPRCTTGTGHSHRRRGQSFFFFTDGPACWMVA